MGRAPSKLFPRRCPRQRSSAEVRELGAAGVPELGRLPSPLTVSRRAWRAAPLPLAVKWTPHPQKIWRRPLPRLASMVRAVSGSTGPCSSSRNEFPQQRCGSGPAARASVAVTPLLKQQDPFPPPRPTVTLPKPDGLHEAKRKAGAGDALSPPPGSRGDFSALAARPDSWPDPAQGKSRPALVVLGRRECRPALAERIPAPVPRG